MTRKSTATTATGELDGLVNLEAAAKILGVSHANVRNIIGRGELQSVKLGARRMVRRSDLAAFIRNL